MTAEGLKDSEGGTNLLSVLVRRSMLQWLLGYGFGYRPEVVDVEYSELLKMKMERRTSPGPVNLQTIPSPVCIPDIRPPPEVLIRSFV